MNKSDWTASRCRVSSPGSALNRAVRAAAFAGANGNPASIQSPDHLWDWMDDAQKDAMARMIRAALESLKTESNGASVDPAKWLSAILDENGLS